MYRTRSQAALAYRDSSEGSRGSYSRPGVSMPEGRNGFFQYSGSVVFPDGLYHINPEKARDPGTLRRDMVAVLGPIECLCRGDTVRLAEILEMVFQENAAMGQDNAYMDHVYGPDAARSFREQGALETAGFVFDSARARAQAITESGYSLFDFMIADRYVVPDKQDHAEHFDFYDASYHISTKHLFRNLSALLERASGLTLGTPTRFDTYQLERLTGRLRMPYQWRSTVDRIARHQCSEFAAAGSPGLVLLSLGPSQLAGSQANETEMIVMASSTALVTFWQHRSEPGILGTAEYVSLTSSRTDLAPRDMYRLLDNIMGAGDEKRSTHEDGQNAVGLAFENTPVSSLIFVTVFGLLKLASDVLGLPRVNESVPANDGPNDHMRFSRHDTGPSLSGHSPLTQSTSGSGRPGLSPSGRKWVRVEVIK